MPNYKLQKKGRSARRVEVRADHIEIHVLALILCAVLAFFIWLYIVGTTTAKDNQNQTPSEPEASAAPISAVLDKSEL